MPDPAPENDIGMDVDDQIVGLWRMGFDTLSIAQGVSMPKHEIVRRLWRKREEYRQGGNE